MIVRALIFLAFVAPGLSAAHAASIEDFFGTYMGRTISAHDAGLNERDLNVSISEHGNGFKLKWTTISYKFDGRVKRKTYTIDFKESNRDGIYASAMRRDKFGNHVPLNPMKGEPYVWARLIDDTLTVYALIITDDGGYEVQVYERTLTPTGLDLKFERLDNGVPQKTITGTLVRY